MDQVSDKYVVRLRVLEYFSNHQCAQKCIFIYILNFN